MSGREVVAVFERFGFVEFSRTGSQIKLYRHLPDGQKETLVADDREPDAGTLRATIRQATHFMPLDELRPHFLG